MDCRPLAAGAIVLLSGCALRVSTPSVAIAHAELSAGAADLTLRIDNPNEGALTLTGVEYTLTDGAFPIARGDADVHDRLPGRGATDVPLHIAFDPPMASTPAEVDLRGVLKFRSGILGFAEVSRSPFDASWPAR